MRRIFTVFIALGICLSSITLAAQTSRSEITEGSHFEIAFAYVWPAHSEKPLPQSVVLCLISRTDASATVSFDSAGVKKVATYPLVAGKTVMVSLPRTVLPSSLLGIERKGITVTSTAPITVTTFTAWQGDGASTLHLPVSSWGVSHWAFSYPQDYYTYTRREFRPGQFVVVASEDNTVLTITSAASIATGPGLPAVMAANSPFTIVLQAHEIVTLFAQIDSNASHTAQTDLTGTHIASSKPVAVISGHAKVAVGEHRPELPPDGAAKSSAHYIRNCINQVVLPDYLADTAFVTVPLMYDHERIATSYDVDTVNRLGDVVRILAIDNGTIVRRLRADGSSYETMATLDAGQYYSDLSVRRPCKWSTSKPAHVMQYGKSYARGTPVAVQDVTPKSLDLPQGHPLVQAGMPTMLVVPGISAWVRRGTFTTQAGMDCFYSLVVPTNLISDLKIDGKALPTTSFTSTLLAGTPYTCIHTAIEEGTHTIASASSDIVFMAWSYGNLDGLAMGRSYGNPIAVNLVQACADSITIAVDSTPGRATVTASVASAPSCSQFSSYEIVSATNARLDSASQTLSVIRAYVSRVKSDSVAHMTLRFTTTSGKTLDYTVVIDSITRPIYNVSLELTTTDGKLAELYINKFKTTSPIPDHFVSCIIRARSKDSILIPRTTRVAGQETVSPDGFGTAGYKFILPSRDTGTTIAQIDYLVKNGKSEDWPIDITDVLWFDADSVLYLVNTTVTRVTTPPPPVSVNDEAPSDPLTPLSLQIAPQPARDNISISYRKGPKGATLRLFDIAGTLVMDLSDSLVAEEGNIAIVTTGLARGMYVLQLQNHEGASATRVILE